MSENDFTNPVPLDYVAATDDSDDDIQASCIVEFKEDRTVSITMEIGIDDMDDFARAHFSSELNDALISGVIQEQLRRDLPNFVAGLDDPTE